MKYDPLKSRLLLFFFGFLLNSSLNAGEFHNWVDLNKYYKKNNFIPEILTQENIGHLPIISELPDDFSEIQDVPTKKKLFYLVTLPLIYNTNTSIMQERRMVINIEKKFATVKILEGETGISPGQACVFYSKDDHGDKLIGGGWIHKTYNANLST